MGKQKRRKSVLDLSPNRSYIQRHGYVMNEEGQFEKYKKSKRRVLINKSSAAGISTDNSSSIISSSNDDAASLAALNTTAKDITNDTSTRGEGNSAD